MVTSPRVAPWRRLAPTWRPAGTGASTGCVRHAPARASPRSARRPLTRRLGRAPPRPARAGQRAARRGQLQDGLQGLRRREGARGRLERGQVWGQGELAGSAHAGREAGRDGDRAAAAPALPEHHQLLWPLPRPGQPPRLHHRDDDLWHAQRVRAIFEGGRGQAHARCGWSGGGARAGGPARWAVRAGC